MTHPERAARRKKIAAFVAGGGTVQDAVRTFGLSYSQVQKACWENGTDIPAVKPIKRTTFQIIAALCTTDESLAKIAARFGISKQRVGQVYHTCRAAGIPVRVR